MKPPPIDPARLAAANAALALFSEGVRLEFVGRRAFVCWTGHGGSPERKQWVTHSGNGFFPTWHKRRGYWGGTTSTAMSQLIRWVQGKPVLPLYSWRYWVSPTVGLARPRGDELLALLSEAGYPERVLCVVCGKHPNGLDWWSRDGVSGPCCRTANRCREVVA